MHKTFRFRLIASYMAVVLFALALVSWSVNKILTRHTIGDLAASLDAQAALLSPRLAIQDILKEKTLSVDALVKKLSRGLTARITVVSAAGRVLGDSQEPYAAVLKMENHSSRPEIAEASNGLSASSIRHSATLNKDMLYLARPLEEKGGIIGYLRLSVPLVNVERALASIRKAIAMAAVLSGVFAAIIGLWLLGAAARPFGDIIYASKKFARGEFSYRINVSSSGELKKLSETLNAMAHEINARIRELESRRQELQAVFSSMSEATIVADRHGSISAINSSAERIFGLAARAAGGKSLIEIFRNAELSAVASEAVSTGKPVFREIEILSPIRGVFRMVASPVFDGGRPDGCVVVAHDITDLRRIEAVRKDFVANASHELRTPLTAIRGCLETIAAGMDDKAQMLEFARTAERQAVRLESLLSDLLNLSAIESGKVTLERADVPLRRLVDAVQAGLARAFAGKGIVFSNEIPASLAVSADPGKLEQILNNLLDNAVKFTGDNGRVAVSHEEQADGDRIIVADTGIGIPDKHISRIFERFYRVDKARSRELGGTGLGLSIVKHLVELHGGRAGVESDEGAGSRFWFTLPRRS